jgi:hypothetical protein
MRSPRKAFAYLFFAGAFAFILLVTHLPLLDLPFFWDELGQFIPAALDIYEDGAFVPHSTLPNAHPPGLMTYLAGCWQVFGYSVSLTRIAMLILAAAGLLGVFLLALHLCRGLRGLPGFTAVLLLLASPLFYTQSMMAQLDMPAMVFTVFAVLLFLQQRYGASAAVCTALVLMKETSLVVPAVLGAWLLWERRFRQACYFLAPALAVALWLAVLLRTTGHLFGNAEFTHYNLWFQLHPVRLSATLLRRVFYLFIDNFHWIGSAALILALRRSTIFTNRSWAIVGAVFLAQTLAVTVLGGAALERYLMPVLPLFYIAVAAAVTVLRSPVRRLTVAALAAGLAAGLFLNSPFPYPYENNLAVVDFVRLQQQAAAWIEVHHPNGAIASAWPFPDALRRPEFGYVSRGIYTRPLPDFDSASVAALKGTQVDALVVYSRTWEPRWSVLHSDWIREFLEKYYFYSPQITAEQIERELGLTRAAGWKQRGQWIEIYERSVLSPQRSASGKKSSTLIADSHFLMIPVGNQFTHRRQSPLVRRLREFADQTARFVCEMLGPIAGPVDAPVPLEKLQHRAERNL